jgi:uncharacterized damage-inducible protein DinB
MNFYGGHNMAESWRTVRGNTIQIAEDIPADKYGFRSSPETMSVAEMLSHMATGTYWALQANFVDKKNDITAETFGGYMGASRALAATLTNKEAIVNALKLHGEDVAKALDGASDSLLAEVVTMPGGSKTRFEILLGLKEHEMHHRGQLMQIERQLGIVPHLTRARLARNAAPAPVPPATSGTTA